MLSKSIYLIIQSFIVLSIYYLSPPPSVFAPLVSMYFGRSIFLTYQANHLLWFYYLLFLYNYLTDSQIAKKMVINLYPLCFSLGFFVTFGYYLLDYSNPENILIRDKLSINYPYIYILVVI